MHELEVLAKRYGRDVSDLTVDRLTLKQHRNLARQEAIEEELGRLTEELRRLRTENERIELTRQLRIDELAESLRTAMGETWSPTAVTGYRLWVIDDGIVRGATGHIWAWTSMDASCKAADPDDDIPHTNRMCSRIGHGCGIYAALTVDSVAPETPTDWVMGTVHLSGKVVEHESGYRAARAEVSGVVARAGDRTLVTDEPRLLAALFADPVTTVATHGEPGPAPDKNQVSQALSSLGKETDQWT